MLRIRREQMEAFARALRRPFELEVRAHLRAHFAERCAHWDARLSTPS